MKIKAMTLFLIIFLFSACGKEDKKVIDDNFTQNTSVTSVIQSIEPEISKGNEAFLQGNFNEAIGYYQEGLNKNKSIAYYNMGVAYYLIRNIDEAEKNFKLAINEDPSFDEAIMNLVAVLAEQGKSTEAEQYITKIVGNNKSARVYIDMANLSLKNGNTAKAVYYYNEAIALDPTSEFVLSNYGNFLVSTGKISEGAEILQKLANKDFAIYYNLAYIETLRGNTAQAYANALQAKQSKDGTLEGLDKLADLFRIMKKYNDEADTLRKLIEWSSNKDYRIRLIKSYLHIWEITKAEDEANYLLKDYPEDSDVAITYYTILIAKRKIEDAGNFLKDRFTKDPSDLLRYYIVKHISLYDRKTDNASKYIVGAPASPYLNLAYTAYYLSKDDIHGAESYLNTVPENLNNDYYIYKAFLVFHDKKYREAEKFALRIDETNPEYFWYNFSIAWNMRNSEKIKELLQEFESDFIMSARIPTFTYNLSPVASDMGFIFKFDAKPEDIATNLLYPLFIEPDEIYPFLALGYNLLKDSEKQAAIDELQKSLAQGDAVEKNNEGVIKMLNFDYENAMKDFLDADRKLDTNPFVQYNIGLAAYFVGDYTTAYDRFNKAIKLNNFFAPAYLGLGLYNMRFEFNEDATQNFSRAITSAESYKASDYDDYDLPTITRSKYLAYIAQGNYTTLLSKLKAEKNQDNFIIGLQALGEYMQTNTTSSITILNENPFYRSTQLAYLLELMATPLNQYQEKNNKDIYTLMEAKYITAIRTKSLSEEFIAQYLNNKDVLTDLVNIAILIGQEEQGLNYLRMLSHLDNEFAPQYKASLYFFMWIKDFVNAEASYTTLIRLGYTDKEVEYYTLLYFLLNYNSRRLSSKLTEYTDAYPNDYRGKVVSLLNDIKEGNTNGFMAKMSSLIRENPFIMDKVSVEIDISRF